MGKFGEGRRCRNGVGAERTGAQAYALRVANDGIRKSGVGQVRRRQRCFYDLQILDQVSGDDQRRQENIGERELVDGRAPGVEPLAETVEMIPSTRGL